LKKGFVICLQGEKGIFSISSYFNDYNIRIHENSHFLLSKLNENQNKKFESDEICFNGESLSLQKFLKQDLYFCPNA
jgi:hypothetical protein